MTEERKTQGAIAGVDYIEAQKAAHAEAYAHILAESRKYERTQRKHRRMDILIVAAIVIAALFVFGAPVVSYMLRHR